ncbi:MAG: glycosyltransferase [Candidatus Latescibacteria bacterium]|nr:glycosyltransferase [Candidatus Latescibacterota bacterium]
MLIVIQLGLLVGLGLLLFYLAFLSLLAFIGRRPTPILPARLRRFAVVVPAHNEELVIEKTLRSLFAVEYPRESFDVIVVADNCRDRTADIARSLGAIVYERQNPALRGKGYALRWCFDRLLHPQPEYDALVVIDADSVVSGNFLAAMNVYLDKGARVIQCSDMVEPQPGAWNAEVTRIGFTLYNYVRPLGRRMLGCPTGLRGNGMCFTPDVLRQVPWQAYSLTEDLEYGLELLLRGIDVVFAPEARVMATMPQDVKNAETQRARWEAGRFPVIRKYAGRLLAAAISRPSFKAFDAWVDLVTPPFVNMLVAVLTMLGINLLLWAVGVEETGRFVWLWLALLGIGVVHVVVGLYAAGADRVMYRAFVHFPRYALWKILLYTSLFRRRQTQEWVRTAREQAIARPAADNPIKQ